MAKFDAGEVSQLLTIVKDISTAHPQFTAISSEASARLKQINDGLAKEKASAPQDPNQYPGMPTSSTPVPSQPVEPPKSEAAASAPKPPSFPKDSGPHATTDHPGSNGLTGSTGPRAMPASTYEEEPPVRRI